MSEAVLIAIITGLCMAIPQMYSTYKQNKFNKKTDKKSDAMEKAVVSILRSQIVSKSEKYQNEGYLPDYARTCLDDLFKQYSDLGGNHGINILVDEVLKLPSIKIRKEN